MNHSENAYRFESNNNKIAVVTNGTAIDTMDILVKTYMEAIAEDINQQVWISLE